MQEEIRQKAYEPQSRMAGGEEGIYGDNYGMAYGALYNSNLFAKDEKTAKAVHEMKNYAYEHFTCAGKLVDEQHGEKATAQLLWICVPFGLFTPEDLVLVAALDEIQDTQRQEDIAMLGWYFAEKANYRKSRSYLAQLKDDHGFVQAVKEIIEEKLRRAGMLSEAPVFHVPCGNFNRYSHQNYEREPWFPKEGDKVFLNAVAWGQYSFPVLWKLSGRALQGKKALLQVCISRSMKTTDSSWENSQAMKKLSITSGQEIIVPKSLDSRYLPKSL